MKKLALVLGLCSSISTSAFASCPGTELARVIQSIENWAGRTGVDPDGDLSGILNYAEAASVVSGYYPRTCGTIDSDKLWNALNSDRCGDLYPAITARCIARAIVRSGLRH